MKVGVIFGKSATLLSNPTKSGSSVQLIVVLLKQITEVQTLAKLKLSHHFPLNYLRNVLCCVKYECHTLKVKRKESRIVPI